MNCNCQDAGFCPTFRRVMPPHLYDICRGEVLTPEKCNAYRAIWARFAAGEVVRLPTTAKLLVGDKLEEIFEEMSLFKFQGCSCESLKRKMNMWGPQGCREHFAEIVHELEENSKKYNWAQKIRAAGNAALTGLVFKINWLNPFPDLVNEAIRRAEVSPPTG